MAGARHNHVKEEAKNKSSYALEPYHHQRAYLFKTSKTNNNHKKSKMFPAAPNTPPQSHRPKAGQTDRPEIAQDGATLNDKPKIAKSKELADRVIQKLRRE